MLASSDVADYFFVIDIGPYSKLYFSQFALFGWITDVEMYMFLPILFLLTSSSFNRQRNKQLHTIKNNQCTFSIPRSFNLTVNHFFGASPTFPDFSLLTSVAHLHLSAQIEFGLQMLLCYYVLPLHFNNL